MTSQRPSTAAEQPDPLRIAVIICTVGRPDFVAELMPFLAAQTRSPDRVVLVVTHPNDAGVSLGTVLGSGTKIEVIISDKGLPRQRNAGLDAVCREPGACDIAVFFDDDFLPSRTALAGIAQTFTAYPEVNGVTGLVLADGINSAGISIEDARRLVANFDADPPPQGTAVPPVLRDDMMGLYGCNMAYRMSAIQSIRFDERLPLYAWQEDVDFGARIPGRRIKTDALAGVHRGAKSGRETAGRRLGYSQIVNPWYLWRKGSITARYAARLALRNFLANHAKALRPEPWIDRLDRAMGNWQGLLDIAIGRAAPERILDIPSSRAKVGSSK